MKDSLSMANYQQQMKYLLKMGKTFDLKLGNFSAEILIDNEKTFFTDHKRDFKVLHSVKALKKDLKPQLGIFFEEINRKSLNYYFIKRDFKESAGTFYNLDIKRAYPQSLYNTGFITESTKNKIESLEKKDKLAVCGMLAYEPDLFSFVNGKLSNQVRIKNEFSDCFFYCVQRIEKLMTDLILACEGNYFFTWVDGIFFPENDVLKNRMIDIIRENGYDFSFDICKNLNYTHEIDSIYFSYEKGTDKKTLIFPDFASLNRKKYKEIVNLIESDEKYKKETALGIDYFIDKFGNIIY